ncbi:hypothetical protein DERP_008971 [Dermatophagoides pteronyssinus]|uniref:Uncharacterized protein n=1 Tax=Dermatophagoides pteronyssinus TaxID=6956 RepID=A0ABQ8JGQ8_DERPT|nr:hypothetical protein DERP_008971 [Dermatophagoides pteronyssinus]
MLLQISEPTKQKNKQANHPVKKFEIVNYDITVKRRLKHPHNVSMPNVKIIKLFVFLFEPDLYLNIFLSATLKGGYKCQWSLQMVNTNVWCISTKPENKNQKPILLPCVYICYI